MRIAILTNYHLEKVGGAEEAIDRLARIWQEKGHTPILFASAGRSSSKGTPRPWTPSYCVEKLPRPKSSTIGLGKYVRILRRAHSQMPFELLFACDAYWPGHVARLFSKSTGVPYVVCSQGSDIMDGSRFLKSGIKRRRIAAAISRANGVVCISRYMQSRATTLAQPTGKMVLIPNGWPDEWATQAPAPRLLPSEYLLGMGRLIELKGFQTLIAAYAQISRQYGEFGLVVAGDGDYRQELERQARGLGLHVDTSAVPPKDSPPWIWLPGFVHGETKRSIVQHATLGIVPSIRQEPLALTMQEFLCSGVPVVASRVGGNPDMIRPGKNGELYESGNVEALSECVSKLLANRDYLATLASQARTSALPYRWSLIAQRYLDFFEQVRQSPKQI